MMMPRTVEELAALPEGGCLSVMTYELTDEDRVRGYAEINGKRVNVPEGVRSVQIPDDSDGVEWKLGRYADGRWFRAARIGGR